MLLILFKGTAARDFCLRYLHSNILTVFEDRVPLNLTFVALVTKPVMRLLTRRQNVDFQYFYLFHD
jgi:hypothetical protein